MEFRYIVYTEGRVEDWMNLVLNEMRSTNKFITKKAIFYYGRNWKVPRYVNFLTIIRICWRKFSVMFSMQRIVLIKVNDRPAGLQCKLLLYYCNILNEYFFENQKSVGIFRTEWILEYQGMVCLAANGVWWTAETEEAFLRIRKGNKRAMKDHLQQQNEQLDGLVVKVRQGR